MAEQLSNMIGGLPADYQAGVEAKFKRGQMARTEELQKPILDPQTGQPTTNIEAILPEMLRRYPDKVMDTISSSISLKALQEHYNKRGLGGDDYGETDRPAPSGRSEPYTGEHATDPDLLKQSAGNAYSINSLVQRSGLVADPKETARIISGQLGIDPQASLDPRQTAQVAAEIENQFGSRPGAPEATGSAGVDIPQPVAPNRVQTVQPSPQQFGQIAASRTPYAAPLQAFQPPPQQASPAAQSPGLMQQDQIDRLRNNASKLYKDAEFLPKQIAEQNKARADKMMDVAKQAQEARDKVTEQRLQLTRGQKEAPPGMSVPQAGAYGEALKEQAKASMQNVAARIQGVRPAQDSIQTLDEMSDAFKVGGKHISTGPGAQNWLKVKQAVNNWAGADIFKGVPESEQIEKLNAQLSAAVVKAMTPRPTQYEFKAFQGQLPGLLTSRGGSANLIDILRQTKVQELELGRMADKFKPGEGKSWSEVEAEYFGKHPIISPLTHKPIDAMQAKDGKWYRPDPDRPGKYLQER
jgi:hypothetical protein